MLQIYIICIYIYILVYIVWIGYGTSKQDVPSNIETVPILSKGFWFFAYLGQRNKHSSDSSAPKLSAQEPLHQSSGSRTLSSVFRPCLESMKGQNRGLLYLAVFFFGYKTCAFPKRRVGRGLPGEPHIKSSTAYQETTSSMCKLCELLILTWLPQRCQRIWGGLGVGTSTCISKGLLTCWLAVADLLTKAVTFKCSTARLGGGNSPHKFQIRDMANMFAWRSLKTLEDVSLK